MFLIAILIPSQQLVDRSKKLLSPRKLFDTSSTPSYLSRFNEARQILSIEVSMEVTEIKIFRSDFWARLLYLYRVSFLTTLDLYKAYFRGRHIREYKENI